MTTQQTLALLRKYESPNVTFIEADRSWPIVWQHASGVHVWDAEGKKYLDLTAGFGVAATGHANPRVVRAGQKQLARLPHAMGDVHPHPGKAELAKQLSKLTFERWGRHATSFTKGRPRLPLRGKTIFCNSGFEAVEAGLKTALLATGKPGVIAFECAYHGVGYGTLSTTHRDHFRSRFVTQLREFGEFVPFPSPTSDLAQIEKAIRKILSKGRTGAVLLEPIQARGGINVPPIAFLRSLRKVCDDFEAVLIADEIYTGFGRTGKWFACEHSSVIPDIICLGKAMAGGFPISACVGRTNLMDAAWPPSDGEAIHTSTFLGNPVGCAMALAQIQEIKVGSLVKSTANLGTYFLRELKKNFANLPLGTEVRGLGLMAGIELWAPDGLPATSIALKTIKSALRRGLILLPEGKDANVISFTPPLIITQAQLVHAMNILLAAFEEVTAPNTRRGLPRLSSH